MVLTEKQNTMEQKSFTKEQIDKNDVFLKTAQIDENSLDEYM